MLFQSRNPWTGELLAEFRSHAPAEVSARLQLSCLAGQKWRTESTEKRLQLLENLSAVFTRDREKLAFSMAEEMGKTLTEAYAEVDKSISLIKYLQANVPQWLAEVRVSENGRNATISKEALGGILLVMPWNFPLWQVCRAALPALCAGNVVLLKHAPNVFRFSGMLESMFLEAGFLPGVFQELRVDVPELEGIVAHEAVSAVSLTGSEAAGKSLAVLAGKYLKKTVLELGGSDPFIVLEDADLFQSSKLAAASRMLNNGQSCIAAKRFFVQESVQNQFLDLLIREISQYLPGNPCLPQTRMGPLARPDLAENLRRQHLASLKAGAEEMYAMKAAYPETANVFLPVILKNVIPGMPAFDEETFGPLVSVTSFRSNTEAISLANQSKYGLGASVHSSDLGLAREVAKGLHCGSVAINQLMRSDPVFPFGGVKASGYGKELAREGFEEFCFKKVIMQP